MTAFIAVIFQVGFVADFCVEPSNGSESASGIITREFQRELAIVPASAARPSWTSDRLRQQSLEALISKLFFSVRAPSAVNRIETVLAAGFKPAEVRVISDRSPPKYSPRA
jgi:hypothetical protein